MQARLNDLITKFKTGNFDGGEYSLKQCIIKYLPAFAAPHSTDLRDAIIEITKTFPDPRLHLIIKQICKAVFPLDVIKLESSYLDEEDG